MIRYELKESFDKYTMKKLQGMKIKQTPAADTKVNLV